MSQNSPHREGDPLALTVLTHQDEYAILTSDETGPFRWPLSKLPAFAAPGKKIFLRALTTETKNTGPAPQNDDLLAVLQALVR